jgi:8-amino-3,8-dideoxy-alpha-D-manno-octulosonate transaminase
LNLLLPDTESAKATVAEFAQAGIGGFDYWYLNMYHFINQWDHLKAMRTASKLPVELLGAPQNYAKLHLPKTQEVIGRLVSFGIRCCWTEDEVRQLARNIAACVKKASLSAAFS